MNPEPEQAQQQAEPTPSKKRTGVPVWRTGKPDAVLAAAVDVARTAIEGIAKASEIGEHLAARTEGDRLVTHLFESKLPGYVGWQWYAVLTRNSRSKVVTVSELGLLPSEDSVLAPEWVPWAERVRPEDAQTEETQTEETPTEGAQKDVQVEAPAGAQEDAPGDQPRAREAEAREAEAQEAEVGATGPAGPDREASGESGGSPATERPSAPAIPAGESDGSQPDGSQDESSRDGDTAEADHPGRG